MANARTRSIVVFPIPRGRGVDHPEKGGLVVGVLGDLEEGHHVPDLLAVEERHAAHENVREPFRAKLGFEGTRLDLGAEENGDVREPRPAPSRELENLLDDELGFGQLVREAREAHRSSFAHGRDERLLVASGVVSDDGVRRLQNRTGRAVVRLETDDLRPLEVAVEAEDLPDVRSPEAVDRLVVVSHHADVPVLGRDLAHDLVLRVVRVLVLVDEDVAISLPAEIADPGVLLQEPNGVEEQIVEIEASRAPQMLLIALPDRGYELVAARRRPLPERCGGLHAILGEGDARKHRGRMHRGLVDPQLAHDRFHRAQLVRAVADGEGSRKAECLCVRTQQADAECVERPDGELARPLSRERSNALFHLPGGLVGEGHREDLGGRRALRQEIGDSRRDDAGLAGAGAREHQERPFEGRDRLPLRGIESG